MSDPVRALGPLERSLRKGRDEGRKALLPYLVAGMVPDWLEVLQAVVAAGADAVEIGIPFSDPMMDGPTIQEACIRALDAGTTLPGVLDALPRAAVGVPLVAMTYYNLFYRMGHRRVAARLVETGVAGAILPDLPLEELGPWARAADEAGVETVLLVAPSTPEPRVRAICERAAGFVYAVGRMGVTGERSEGARSGVEVAERVRSVTDIPVCVGVGVSTPEQAVEACAVADGVAVGSALVRRLLEGGGPDGAAELVASFRSALDAMADPGGGGDGRPD